jgi:hypothetical protein
MAPRRYTTRNLYHFPLKTTATNKTYTKNINNTNYKIEEMQVYRNHTYIYIYIYIYVCFFGSAAQRGLWSRTTRFLDHT